MVKMRMPVVRSLPVFMTGAMNLTQRWTTLAPKSLFFHVLFNRYFRQGAPVATTMAANPPLFDPLFLHIRLAACGADKHPFFVEHPALFLHWFPAITW